MTYTYAILTVTQAAWDEIETKLRAAGHEQAIHTDDDEGPLLDMHGIALQRGDL